MSGTEYANRYEQAVDGVSVRIRGGVGVVHDWSGTWVCREASWEAAREALKTQGPFPSGDQLSNGRERAQGELCLAVLRDGWPVVVLLSGGAIARHGGVSLGKQMVQRAYELGLMDVATALSLGVEAAGEPDLMHPNGRCTCAGEGACEWCRKHGK